MKIRQTLSIVGVIALIALAFPARADRPVTEKNDSLQTSIPLRSKGNVKQVRQKKGNTTLRRTDVLRSRGEIRTVRQDSILRPLQVEKKK